MKKITPQTKDITTQNIDQIAQLFPQVITEKEDANGNIIKAIDFESLKQHLSTELVEGSDERYRLDWPGKRASILKANTPINSTLKPDRESSVNFDTTENLYIEGDNFEVLKILQESYLGKIKMIYIDPPYNTGKDFVYKDNFKVSKDAYENELGTEDEEGGKLFKNTDTNGRFHSDWLSMMYERLLVARDLLTDDGVIFMSIDDNEVHNLRKISDEVFGEENFVSQFIWKKKQGGGNDSNAIVVEHEYIVSFSKSINKLKLNKDVNYKLDDSLYPFKDEIGEYGLITLDKSSIRFSYSLVFEIKDSEGNIYFPRVIKGKQSCWRWGKTKVANEYEKLVFKNGKESVRIILQGTPVQISSDEVRSQILNFEEVKNIHDCHLWTMDGEYNVLTIHLIVIDTLSWEEGKILKKRIKKVLHDDFSLEHVTLELELSSEDCDYIDCV